MSSTDVTIIYGPPASGKTHSAAEFMAHYGRDRLIQDWQYPMIKRRHREAMEVVPGSLILTTATEREILCALAGTKIRRLHQDKPEPLTYDLISIYDARAAIGLPPRYIHVPKLCRRPLRHDTDYPGTIVDANDRPLLVVDYDNERPDHEVIAIADKIVAALNKPDALL